MTTPASPCRPFAAGTFDFVTPTTNLHVCVNANNAVFVQVNNLSSGNNGFQASISDVNGSSPSAYVSLTREGSSSLWSGWVNAGIVPSTTPVLNNKRVSVQALDGNDVADMDSKDFKASRCGSGSGSNNEVYAAAALQNRFAQKDQPVPVALSLSLDSPVLDGSSKASTQLNTPTKLVYSQDAKYFSDWFSAPVVFCTDSGEAGYWILDKTAPRTWTLQLKRALSLVATYVLKTLDDRDATFPLRLQLQGEAGGECVGWPRTVTITPAP